MPSLSPAAIQALISQDPQSLINAYQNMATSVGLYPKTSSSVTSPASLLPEEAKEVEQVNPILNTAPNSGSGGFGYSGAGSNKTSADMQSYIDMINATTEANNAWAAEQAQKQMDFQERLVRNAHQYEMEDLKKAGLNPVLTASGGNGASTASGAMAQPDTSNTRLLAEMSLGAVNSLGSNAVQLASGFNSRESNNFKNSLLNAASKYFVPTLVKGVASGLAKSLF